jgi:hypothetical protein
MDVVFELASSTVWWAFLASSIDLVESISSSRACQTLDFTIIEFACSAVGNVAWLTVPVGIEAIS